MKDIIRQAVADAAQWLYQNRDAASQFWLGKTAPEHILRAYANASQFDSEKRRKEQLADFVAKPVIDSVLITGLGGFVAHGAGAVGRTVMIEPPPMVTVRDDKGEFSRQPACDWQMQCIARGKRRAEVADAAWFLLNVDGAHRDWIKEQPSETLVREARRVPDGCIRHATQGRDFNKEVELPVPRDPMWSVAVFCAYDGAEGDGRVWLSTKEDDEPMIAIEGRENAKILASMLMDWAQPDDVIVPRALLERLASGIPDFNAMDELRALLK